jgi:hypothetical protein
MSNDSPKPTRLARAILAEHDDRACAACLDGLEAYVDAQLAGAAYAALYPQVAMHLDGCVDCAESYALLYEARLAEGQLPAPERVPAPDLSFLRASGPAQPPLDRAGQLAAALTAAIERAGARLRLTLSQALLDLLPPPATAPALRGAPGALLDLDAPVDDPAVARVHLAALPRAGAPGRCDLRVRLALHGRDWPDLAGVPVSLAVGGQAWRALTDQWGEVLFEDLPATGLAGAALMVEVE